MVFKTVMKKNGREFADEAVYTLPGISLELSVDCKGQPARATKLPTPSPDFRSKHVHTQERVLSSALSLRS